MSKVYCGKPCSGIDPYCPDCDGSADPAPPEADEGITELDIDLLRLEALAYVPRHKNEPAMFDMYELRKYIKSLLNSALIKELNFVLDNMFANEKVDSQAIVDRINQLKGNSE